MSLIVTCVVCGKATRGGRLPREGRHHPGDGSERYPRRHNGPNGNLCSGTFDFGAWSHGSDEAQQ